MKIARGMAREFLNLHVQFLSLVYDPEEPSNSEPPILRAKGTEIEVLRTSDYDPSKADFRITVPVTRVVETEDGLGVAYLCVYAPDQIDSHRTFAKETVIRLAMEQFMYERRTKNVDVNHDWNPEADRFVCECWQVREGDPLFVERRHIGAWVVGVKLNKEDLKKAKEGKLRGVSLAGRATVGPEIEVGDGEDAELAKWSTAFINNLPDSSFAYIESGGEKDDDGKTTPRSLRHLPYKNADGVPDLPHVKNALSRLDQTEGILDSRREKIRSMLEGILEKAKKEERTMKIGGVEQTEVSRAQKLVAAVLGEKVARSVFGDKLKSQKDTKRLQDLWYLLSDSFYTIIGSTEISDKEQAIEDACADFIDAVKEGTTVEKAKIRHSSGGEMADVVKRVRAAAGAQDGNGATGPVAGTEEGDMEGLKELQELVKGIGDRLGVIEKSVKDLDVAKVVGDAVQPLKDASAKVETRLAALETGVAEVKKTAGDAAKASDLTSVIDRVKKVEGTRQPGAAETDPPAGGEGAPGDAVDAAVESIRGKAIGGKQVRRFKSLGKAFCR